MNQRDIVQLVGDSFSIEFSGIKRAATTLVRKFCNITGLIPHPLEYRTNTV